MWMNSQATDRPVTGTPVRSGIVDERCVPWIVN
jgi:hypothetical protein